MIHDRTHELATLHAEIFGQHNLPGSGEVPAFIDPRDSSFDTVFDPTQLPASVTDVSDDDLVNRAHAASNGAKFSALWSGDWSGYGSQSEADAALARVLDTR